MKPGEMRGLGQAHERVTVERWREGESSVAVDDVAEECPVALVYNGVPFAVMLATPLDLEDFARGFTWTEGIVEHPDECQGIEIEPEQQGYSIYVSVPKARTASLSERRRSLAGRTGCGLCGTQMLDDAIRPVRQVTPLAPGLDHAAIQRARQSLATGQ
ncbi:MAG: formate dehydrogenase accessory sulfurtransferase FdhD, partial [Vicinamibacterales bacterium]